eukprot:5085930-Amphidinium_carterae.1
MQQLTMLRLPCERCSDGGQKRYLEHLSELASVRMACVASKDQRSLQSMGSSHHALEWLMSMDIA